MQRHGRDRPATITPEQAFAKTLREIRKRRSISQEELGFESGYHRTYISMLERGKMNPSLRTLLSLAAALNIPAAELVGDVERALGRRWRREPTR
jgi:transcriptional regulator with XRE-family HTH domain